MEKSKIDKIFIDKAIKIRKEYVKCMTDINLDISKLNKYKNEIEKIVEEGDKVVELYDNEANENYKKEMQNVAYELYLNVEKIQKQLNPNKERIKKLEKESDLLYVSIHERYPELTIEDIKEQIIPYLDE
jgi:hypothetical protein